MTTPEENQMTSHPQPSVANGEPEVVGYGQWQDVATAPRTCEIVIVRTKLGAVFAAFMGTLVQGPDGDAFAWTAADEGIHPPCWTDGLCRASNADEEPSDPPVGWVPIPSAVVPDSMPSPCGAKPLPTVEDGSGTRREEIKSAFVAGCVEMATFSGHPTDDFDEAGYDYADSLALIRGEGE